MSLKSLVGKFAKHPTAPPLPDKPEDALAHVDPRVREALCSLYRAEPQRGFDGQLHPLDPNVKISLQQGLWLYDQTLSLKAQDTLEVGLAYGFSTLYFLAARWKLGSGRHIAIDPYQDSEWHGIGRTLLASLAKEPTFTWLKKTSIFIDGGHIYEDVLSDFFLYARLCKVGGYLVLDDTWMPSVKTVVSFVQTNRSDFETIPSPCPNICVLHKLHEDNRKWDFFRPFTTNHPPNP
jgi:hypothetical protein